MSLRPQSKQQRRFYKQSDVGASARAGAAPLLVYEVLEEDGGVATTTSRLIDANGKYLYGLKPVLSTNACGDGRIHAFDASGTVLERELNAPKISQLKSSSSNGRSLLDLKNPSSPKQRPRFHRNWDDADGGEGTTVTVVGIDPTGEKRGGVGSPGAFFTFLCLFFLPSSFCFGAGEDEEEEKNFLTSFLLLSLLLSLSLIMLLLLLLLLLQLPFFFFSPVITQRQLRGEQGREAFLTGADAKATERYWRYVFEHVPDEHIAPMDMKPLLNVRETHLDILLTPPGAKYQMGGVPVHEQQYPSRPAAEDRSAAGGSPEGEKKSKSRISKMFAKAASEIPTGAQVSMISSLPDLMPGSGEQLLLKATCRADGRFWSSVRSQLRSFESDHSMTHEVDRNDEFLVHQ
jgi:hypothetical protein